MMIWELFNYIDFIVFNGIWNGSLDVGNSWVNKIDCKSVKIWNEVEHMKFEMLG